MAYVYNSQLAHNKDEESPEILGLGYRPPMMQRFRIMRRGVLPCPNKWLQLRAEKIANYMSNWLSYGASTAKVISADNYMNNCIGRKERTSVKSLS